MMLKLVTSANEQINSFFRFFSQECFTSVIPAKNLIRDKILGFKGKAH